MLAMRLRNSNPETEVRCSVMRTLIVAALFFIALTQVGIVLQLRELKHQLRRYHMANKDLLDQLNAQLAQNTSVVSSATLALNTFVKTVADLTKSLEDAHADDDTEAVTAAIAALKANNEALAAAVPATAAAVSEGTAAAGT